MTNLENRRTLHAKIHPYDPTSKPKKRTALGRFKHENVEVVVNHDGRIVIYLGDDERGEFLFCYVSDGVYAEGGDTDDLIGDCCGAPRSWCCRRLTTTWCKGALYLETAPFLSARFESASLFHSYEARLPGLDRLW